jgi:hypothetical protein
MYAERVDSGCADVEGVDVGCVDSEYVMQRL